MEQYGQSSQAQSSQAQSSQVEPLPVVHWPGVTPPHGVMFDASDPAQPSQASPGQPAPVGPAPPGQAGGGGAALAEAVGAPAGGRPVAAPEAVAAAGFGRAYQPAGGTRPAARTDGRTHPARIQVPMVAASVGIGLLLSCVPLVVAHLGGPAARTPVSTPSGFVLDSNAGQSPSP